MSNFLLSVPVLLSTLALLFSGFTAYQVFNLQQRISTTNNIGSEGAIASNQTAPNQVGNQQPETTSISPVPSPNASGIQQVNLYSLPLETRRKLNY